MFLQKVTPILLFLSRLIGKIPLIGNTIKKLVPVANHHGILPLSDKQHLEWSLLDTFDWLSPAYDNPQTKQSVYSWMKDANLKNIEVLKAGHLVARGNK